MDPIIRVVNYLFENNNLENDDQTLDSFFDNGTAFPRFVELIFQEKISGIFTDPTNENERKRNNNSALAFLFEKNKEIANLSPKYDTEEDKARLLSLILTKQCFKIDKKEIIKECNIIVDPLDIMYKNISEEQNIDCILCLLNQLTDGKVKIKTETKNIDLIINDISKKTDVPIVIDKESSNSNRKFTYLIQILIIFDFFQRQIFRLKEFMSMFDSQDQINDFEEEEDHLKHKTELNKDSDTYKIEEEDKDDEKLNKPKDDDEKSKDKDDDEINKDKDDDDEINKDKDDDEYEEEESLDYFNSKYTDSIYGSFLADRCNDYFDIFVVDKSDSGKESQKENEDEATQSVKKEESIDDIEEDYEETSENEEEETNDDDKDINYQSQIESIIERLQSTIKEEENDDESVVEEEEEELEDEEEKLEYKNFLNSSTIQKLDDKESKLINKAILNTINSIGSTVLHFDDILESIEINSIVKFLSLFFNEEEDITFLKNMLTDKADYLQKLRKIVNFLGEKNSIFKVLQFDFNDPKQKEPSAVLLYTKILDLFFLKQTKSEMIDRCESLLFTKIDQKDTLYGLSLRIKNNKKLRKEILNDWNVYLALVYYANENGIHFIKKEVPKEKYSFETKQIPKIIDENYLKKAKHYFGPMFYQLQFIFDSIEETNSTIQDSAIIELINDKEHEEETKSTSDDDDEDEDYENKDGNNKIQYEFIDRFLSFFAANDSKEDNVIDTFKSRMLYKSLELSKTVQNKIAGSLSKPEVFWNKNYSNSIFKNGILTLKEKDSYNDWEEAFNQIKTTKLNKTNSFNSKLIEFINMEPNESKKLYKFFIYDGKEMKWKINNESIELFKQEMNTNDSPIVLFFNSDEKAVKSLYSKLVYSLPDLSTEDNSEEIFVYALYGKPIEKEKTRLFKKVIESKNPIYLLLHVPRNIIRNKLKMKNNYTFNNLNTIIFQIYYFLKIVSDIEIIVLKGEYYKDQIRLVKRYNKIWSPYKNSIDSLIQTKNLIFSSYKPRNEKDLSSDGDDFDDETNNNKYDYQNDFNNEIVSINNLEIFEKQPNYIILANSDQLDSKDYCNRADQTNFFKGMKKYINKTGDCDCYFNFINVANSSTYLDFLATLNEVVFNSCNDCSKENAFKKFSFIELANISGYYIQCKLGIKPKRPLKDMIVKRFFKYKDFNYSFRSDLYLLTQLNNELINTYPPIDIKYDEECNSVISGIKNDKTKRYQYVIVDQLNKSSKSSLEFWENGIKKKDFWSIEDRNNVKTNHDNFLRNEYYDIIYEIYSQKELSHVFDGNYSVLEERIQQDNKKIDDCFRKFDDEILNERFIDDNQKSIENIDDLKDKATNYMIREKENMREIKVIVESDDFDEIFESDF